EHTLGEDEAALLGLRLQDLEDQLLFAHPGRAAHRQVLGDLGELLDAHVLQIGDAQTVASRRGRLWRRRVRVGAVGGGWGGWRAGGGGGGGAAAEPVSAAGVSAVGAAG